MSIDNGSRKRGRQIYGFTELDEIAWFPNLTSIPRYYSFSVVTASEEIINPFSCPFDPVTPSLVGETMHNCKERNSNSIAARQKLSN